MATSKQNLLKKLSSKLATQGAIVPAKTPGNNLKLVLEEHLDAIAAAHGSNHHAVHQSLPIV